MRKNSLEENGGILRRLAARGRMPVGRRAGVSGFTLVEMLVATFVLVIILGMTLQITNYANNLFLNTRKRIDTFQEARAGFESMTRTISQAMLNTYWDYANGTAGSGTGSPRPQPASYANSSSYNTAINAWQPTQFLRNSSLHFVCGPIQPAITSSGSVGPILASAAYSVTSPFSKMVGQGIFFQAPIGYSDVNANAVMPNLLNACGYFVQFSSDNPDRPSFLVGTEAGVTTVGSDTLLVKFRFRLKQLALPAEYNYTNQYVVSFVPTAVTVNNYNWWASYPLEKKNLNGGALPFNPTYTLAQNVIALVIEPQRSPNYPVPTGAPVELSPYYFYDSRAWAQSSGATSATAIATRNQLPPQVMVTMVAIDEASAARLQALYGGTNGTTLPTFSDSTSANSVLPNGLYSTTGASKLFLQASKTPGSGAYDQYQSDLATLEQALVNEKITYRVFTTNVTILQSKFSD